MKWNKQQTDLFQRESRRLADHYPELVLEPWDEGWARVTGSIEIVPEIRYTLLLLVRPGYPDEEPVLICQRDEIPWEIDRHVYERNGVACLCVRSETRKHWPWGSNLTDFLDKLVVPFFKGQNYYDSHGHWPPSGERSHGKPGIIEAYTEILSDLDDPTVKPIHDFLRLLARENPPKGHESCPCGSGKKLRHCHQALLTRLRETIAPHHAALDLADLSK